MSVGANNFYQTMRDKTAFTMLQKYGFQAGIQVQTGDTYDPISGMVTNTPTWMVFPCVALYGEGRSGGGVSTSNSGNTLTRKVKKTVWLDATQLTITPVPTDLFQDENGTTLEILSVDPVNPGGIVIMWKIEVIR